MEIWTIQNERVWDVIEHEGSYHTPTRRSYPYSEKNGEPDLALMICYKWMANRLRRKTGRETPANAKFPVWGWARQWDGKGAKPDMRSWTTNEVEKVVRLRLEIPEERLLVSSFDMWHIPLNRGYLSFTREDDKQFDEWCESVGIDRFHQDIWDFNKQTPFLREARRRVFKSWEGIFPPFPKTYDEDWTGNLDDDALQAVFWEIKAADIVSCEHFTTRKAARF